MSVLNLIDFVIPLPGISCSFHEAIHVCNPYLATPRCTVSVNHVFHVKKFSVVQINQDCLDGVIYSWQILEKRINNYNL